MFRVPAGRSAAPELRRSFGASRRASSLIDRIPRLIRHVSSRLFQRENVVHMLVLADRGVQGACEDLSITGQVVTHPREKVSERRPCKFARSETGRRWLSYRLPG